MAFTIQFVFAISKSKSKMQNVEHTYWRKKYAILDVMLKLCFLAEFTHQWCLFASVL